MKNKIISLKRAEYSERIWLSAMNISSEEFMVDQSQFLGSAEVEGYFQTVSFIKATVSASLCATSSGTCLIKPLWPLVNHDGPNTNLQPWQ